MPVPTRVQPEKNIWIAAGDGDLARVQELVGQGLSPNVPDPNTYTPMHAAASYGHIHVLEYLVSQGGDVNVTDEDGETPLYVVENLETARWLVEHGAIVDRRNLEDISPAANLVEEFPEVSAYLESIAPSASAGQAHAQTVHAPSQHAQEQASETLTSSLMDSVQDIMQRAEAEGRDPDAELRDAVGRAVLQGVVTGYELGDAAQDTEDRRAGNGPPEQNGAKRPRMDDGSS